MSTPLHTCCPPGPGGQVLTYIDTNGYYLSSCSGTLLQVVSWTGGATQGVYGKCVYTQCAPAAYGSAYDPIDCPCCPQGYVWDSKALICRSTIRSSDVTYPIPCIACVCPDPPPPPVCDTCSNGALPITFHFNENVKNCVDCKPEGEPNLSPFKAFIADRLIAPIINFIRR